MKKLVISACCFLLALQALAQRGLNDIRGEVYNLDTREPIELASVRNLTMNTLAITNKAGVFNIKARIGDSIVVHSLAYESDTLVVGSKKEYVVFLELHATALEEVRIRQAKAVPVNIPEHPFKGKAVTNKVDYFSAEANTADRSRREIGGLNIRVWSNKKAEKKRAIIAGLAEEKKHELELRRVFTEKTISQYLPLRGDDLKAFMVLYRPDMETTANLGEYDIVLYLNDSYKKFQTLTPEQRRQALLPVKE